MSSCETWEESPFGPRTTTTPQESVALAPILSSRPSNTSSPGLTTTSARMAPESPTTPPPVSPKSRLPLLSWLSSKSTGTWNESRTRNWEKRQSRCPVPGKDTSNTRKTVPASIAASSTTSMDHPVSTSSNTRVLLVSCSMRCTRCATGHPGQRHAVAPGRSFKSRRTSSRVPVTVTSRTRRTVPTSTTAVTLAKDSSNHTSSNVPSTWLSMRKNCSVTGNGW